MVSHSAEHHPHLLHQRPGAREAAEAIYFDDVEEAIAAHEANMAA